MNAFRPVIASFVVLVAGCTSTSEPGTPLMSSSSSHQARIPPAAPPRVLFVVSTHREMAGEATGTYLPELAHAHEVFTEAGYDVDYVSVTGGRVPLYGGEEDPSSQAFLKDEVAVAEVHQSHRPAEIDARRYDAIFYVGGHGTMWDFPDQPSVAALAQRIYADGGVVAAVCHGPAGLIGLVSDDGQPMVAGRRVAAFTNAEERAVGHDDHVPFLLETKLRELGAEIVATEVWTENVQVAGRLITGQNPASARGVAAATVRALR